MSSDLSDPRAAALEGYLNGREAAGYRIETRTRMQAVIVRRHPLYLILRCFGAGNVGQQRLVVSVDAHGTVSTVAAQRARW